ncbi:hypothetical protein U9M48_005669 [Paspalum notatum var. saurae]|uniref:Uncharacterized protein n=1 Tax=Paspalum notatum var. saurae TaxID=547442 RepID=A0AAQ3PXA7_PASNO
MSELQVLFLYNNALTGSIPPRLWSLSKLQLLVLLLNNFTGDVVVDDSKGMAARSLTDIDISFNYKLTGSIPEAFGLLENLTTLSLSFNSFSGEIPMTLPAELGKHSDLGHVEVHDNTLLGAIPNGLCARGQLIYLHADNNRFKGPIP